MKRLLHCFALLVVAGGLVAFTALPAQTPDPLAIGAEAPLTDVELVGIDGETYTLGTHAGESGLLVMFTCNTCPYVHAWEDRYNAIAAQAEALGVGFIALNPNEKLRGDSESMAAMRARAEEMGYAFPYVVDADHRLADAFGATRTPEMFLFDDAMRLVYHGAIDDNAQDASAVQANYMMDALHALADGHTIDPAETRSVGCTIKRVS